MKKIIERNITNEDGDIYGVCGDITRLGAYRAIRQDLRDCGTLDEVEFKQEDLQQITFYQTTLCPHDGEHTAYIWWGKWVDGERVKSLGKRYC